MPLNLNSLEQPTDQINASNASNSQTDTNVRDIKRCEFNGCKKKLSIIDRELGCKCGKHFCQMHKFFNLHACTYDYKSDYMEILKKQNPTIVSSKLTPMSA
jgi:hypothetical protein